MKVIKKFMVIAILEVFKEKGCKSIDEAIVFLNKEVKNDTDIAFSFEKAN